MKRIKKSLTVFIMLLCILTVGVSADNVYSTQNDPLVSLSYVNDVLKPQIVAQVMEKIEAEYVKITDITSVNAANYKVVTLKKDSTLMAKGVCEAVILSGNATVIVTSSQNISAGNGINDLTAGNVVTNGKVLPFSHYLVISSADGRGFYAASGDVTLLIRGEYSIAS